MTIIFDGIDDTVKSMNIVLDTTIFIGACLDQAVANHLVMQCLQDSVTPLMEASLLAESHCQWTRIYYAW